MRTLRTAGMALLIVVMSVVVLALATTLGLLLIDMVLGWAR